MLSPIPEEYAKIYLFEKIILDLLDLGYKLRQKAIDENEEEKDDENMDKEKKKKKKK